MYALPQVSALQLMAEAAEPAYMNPSSMYHGEINPGFMGDNLSIAGSRKSGALQPVMLMPHGPVPDERSATQKNIYIFFRSIYFIYYSDSLSTRSPRVAASPPTGPPRCSTIPPSTTSSSRTDLDTSTCYVMILM